MADTPPSQSHHASFESIRREDEHGHEYWSARELAPLLEYQKWQNFPQVIDKARLACEKSGKHVADHFTDVSKMVEIGSGALRAVADVHLSRYACYLIVQNGDPAKPVIANGQTYFAVQTRRQELGADYELVNYQRRKNLAAPAELKAVHPLGKAPILEDDGEVIAESAPAGKARTAAG